MLLTRQRKSIRLRNYDYSSTGYYFVTICTQNRICFFGDIVDGKMVLNNAGKMIYTKIQELRQYKNVDIDIFCVMPNHVHVIIIFVGADPRVRPVVDESTGLGSTQGSTPTLGKCIKKFKTLTTYIYIQNIRKKNWEPFNNRLWQRNYYEHIIRDEDDLEKIRKYIFDNPAKWAHDVNNLTTPSS